MKQYRITLIGFMGTGKTSVGKRLAERLRWSFVDTDKEIETKENRSIPEIFEREGETYFRQVESIMLKECLQTPDCVIATGGGVVLNQENRKVLKESSVVVALTARINELVIRLQGDSHRPLLQGNLEEKIETRLKERKGLYDFAHITVDTTGKSVEQICDEILSSLP